MNKNDKRAIELLESLQNALANDDLIARGNRTRRLLEVLLIKKPPLEFRMEPDQNHKRPHYHLNIGKEKHVASICINSGEVLAGSVPNKYSKTVSKWNTSNKQELLNVWNNLQNGGDGKLFISKLET